MAVLSADVARKWTVVERLQETNIAGVDGWPPSQFEADAMADDKTRTT